MNPYPQRRTYTFVLTLLSDSHDEEHLRGRVRAVATGEEISFTNIRQLLDFCYAQLRAIPDGTTTVALVDDEREP